MLKDPVPDVLGNAGFNYFEREGLCFALAPVVVEGRLALTVFYQSRYSNPCAAEILVRPASASNECGLSTLRLRVDCEGGGVGQVAVPWLVNTARPGRKVECFLGADVAYPDGRGSLLRSRSGLAIGSIEDASTLEILHLLATPAKFTFSFPEGITPSAKADRNATSREPLASTGPGSSSVIGSAKVEAKHSGSRPMAVTCEKCRHSYEYTLFREAEATGEDVDQELARSKAEAEAQRKLAELLANGSDIVPCPKCGALTTRMRDQKISNRRDGIGTVVAGGVVALVGAGICGGTYLVQKATGRLFYVIGILGLAVAGFGLVIIGRGIIATLTGQPVDDSGNPKGDS